MRNERTGAGGRVVEKVPQAEHEALPQLRLRQHLEPDELRESFVPDHAQHLDLTALDRLQELPLWPVPACGRHHSVSLRSIGQSRRTNQKDRDGEKKVESGVLGLGSASRCGVAPSDS